MSNQPGDADSHVFWAAIRQGELLVRSCPRCGPLRSLGQGVCTHCGVRAEWVISEGRGEIYAITVVQEAFAPRRFRDQAPYAVALVDLYDGVRILVHLRAPDPEMIRIGDIVELSVPESPIDDQVPYFVLAKPSGTGRTDG